MSDDRTISNAVEKLYDTYPFPPDAMSDEAPPGYNWRWHWTGAYSFCTGQKPPRQDIRILDAGCGTGVGTEYLAHLNSQAEVVAVDLSSGALNIAQKRCKGSGVDRVEFHHLSLYDVAQISGEFDLINCVGVLHHLPDPVRGIQALAKKLAPGGLFHIFVYAELGRWEIALMQEAIALLQGEKRGDYSDGVKVGRDVFSSLPEDNPLVQREKTRWSMENHKDESFADMYVHPQEVDYNINTLFELIDASGLEFIGFSNPQFWQLERLLGKSPDLMARASQLGERDRYRLIELLDPKNITHYEFFLGRSPLVKTDWSQEETFLSGIPELHPCIHGWPSRTLFNADYELIDLSEQDLTFLQICETNSQANKTLGEILAESALNLEEARTLFAKRLFVLGV
ncbi:class I SAM-dependent methyltransferase [Spirulina sp. 06S082]|uniref:class I SAM-dependent methyltransferase n=1 Tax=Spirulina sp. 06S082 TaxID=3110248 RepID=UPI002B1F21F8|nr:class I SAM-dependent methyltransferase [Spirulina sp. 06S082]MEA5468871.1 class I SAM-dependent methyltransferase [Spirulina sp. 06S082]